MLELLIPVLGPILNKIIPDPKERAEAEAQMRAQLAEAEKSRLEAETARIQAMAQVMTADAQSESALTRSMRPIIVIWGLSMMTFIIVAAFFGGADEMLSALARVPAELWTLVTVPVGIYTLGRTVEKGVQAAVSKQR